MRFHSSPKRSLHQKVKSQREKNSKGATKLTKGNGMSLSQEEDIEIKTGKVRKSVLPNLKLLLNVNGFVRRSPNRSSLLLPLLARDALWTVTSNLLHLNRRRLLLPFLPILSMPTSSAPTDRYWKTTPRLKPPRVKSTSGSRPTSRTRPA